MTRRRVDRITDQVPENNFSPVAASFNEMQRRLRHPYEAGYLESLGGEGPQDMYQNVVQAAVAGDFRPEAGIFTSSSGNRNSGYAGAGIDAHNDNRPAPSARPAKRARTAGLCIVCLDNKPLEEVVRLPCDHTYCALCLRSLFETAMARASSFPLRCCSQIPVAVARPYLDVGLIKRYLERKVEYETRDKTYCHVADCSAFIPPYLMEDQTAICLECKEVTCVSCKGPSHEGDCPDEPGLKELLDTAKQHRWKRCWSCNRMVEKRGGCSHIRCICGVEFCYTCGDRFTGQESRCQCRYSNVRPPQPPMTMILPKAQISAGRPLQYEEYEMQLGLIRAQRLSRETMQRHEDLERATAAATAD